MRLFCYRSRGTTVTGACAQRNVYLLLSEPFAGKPHGKFIVFVNYLLTYVSQLLISLKTNNNNSTAGHESVFNSEYSYLCLPSTLWHTMGTPRHTRDVTLWLSRTTDNSNFFIGSREVRDNERRLYLFASCRLTIIAAFYASLYI